ncbi:hypothetical protein [uncultured Tateyamaria sp.]|uniref:hypothetical protein n=1 Tax=uncultured Tateyamaria sp. TaxID=455651 RepID=UPI00262A66E9|nr:hypothetical protein [uncultured Tateyamaria sp.]
MSSMAIGLGLSQAQSPGTLNVQIFETVEPDYFLPLTAGVGITIVGILGPVTHSGIYPVQSDALSNALLNVRAPQIEQAVPGAPLRLTSPGLWAHDDQNSGPTRSYRWQRNGIDIPGATAPEYSTTAADADQDLQLIETVAGANGERSTASNSIVAVHEQGLFATTLKAGGLLDIIGNDGRSFALDDPADIYDGTYSVADLSAGPVALVDAVLNATAAPDVGQTLTITPALFACDPALGEIAVSYATNGASSVDVSDPNAPTLVADAADAGTTLVVTANATQGGASVDSVSNGVEIPAVPEITGTRPSIDLNLTEGQTLDEVVTWGSDYASNVGAIQSVLRQVRTDLADWSAYDGAAVLEAGRDYRVREKITDDQGNFKRFYSRFRTAAPLPDTFNIVLGNDGTLQIEDNDGRSFTLEEGRYDGTYSVAEGTLASGAVSLVAPVLIADGNAVAGETLAIAPALFAYDPALGALSVNYATNGASTVDASDPAAPVLMIDPADAETTLSVTATATQGANDTSTSSNGVAIAALSGAFNIVLGSDGTLQIEGNDGRSFPVDDSQDRYDGMYNVNAGSLEAGAVPLVAPILTSDGTPTAGETLNIVPALFAYDPDFGELSVSYSTNGTNAVDARDPDNPTLLISTADAESTLRVTAQATQGTNTIDAASNGVAIAEAPSAPSATTPTFVQPAPIANYDNSSTASETMDLSAGAAGDTVLIHYGSDSASAPVSLTIDGQAMTLIASAAAGSDGNKTSGYLYELVLTNVGSASASVDVDLGGSSSNGHIFVGAIVSGGARVAADGDQTADASLLSTSVAPTVSENLVLSFVSGYSDRMNGNESWSGTTSQGSRLTAFFGSTFATAEDVPASTFTSTLQIDGGTQSWQHGASMTTVVYNGV